MPVRRPRQRMEARRRRVRAPSRPARRHRRRTHLRRSSSAMSLAAAIRRHPRSPAPRNCRRQRLPARPLQAASRCSPDDQAQRPALNRPPPRCRMQMLQRLPRCARRRRGATCPARVSPPPAMAALISIALPRRAHRCHHYHSCVRASCTSAPRWALSAPPRLAPRLRPRVRTRSRSCSAPAREKVPSRRRRTAKTRRRRLIFSNADRAATHDDRTPRRACWVRLRSAARCGAAAPLPTSASSPSVSGASTSWERRRRSSPPRRQQPRLRIRSEEAPCAGARGALRWALHDLPRAALPPRPRRFAAAAKRQPLRSQCLLQSQRRPCRHYSASRVHARWHAHK